ncbi:MAG: 30S ribosomal protein S2 [Holosporales bacterium]|jgi:small subunit ribosomal protein S2|nr:30S ribosomal protein S2 [Holosporales bacterium]
MTIPAVDIRSLVEAGLHYGHTTERWNPLMSPYIFGSRNGIHIIDLEQTVPLLQSAMSVAYGIAKAGGRILFVGTKAQACDIIKLSAERCGQYYVNHRWLGGMLTNWKTVSQAIDRLKELEATLENPRFMTKKEIIKMRRTVDKMNSVLQGVREMRGTPDLLFVIDTNKEAIAVSEATKLKIPIIAIVDTNCNPNNITHMIPGNDDAIRSIRICCDLISSSVLEGVQDGLSAAGVDLGASSGLPIAEAIAEDSAGGPAGEDDVIDGRLGDDADFVAVFDSAEQESDGEVADDATQE